MIISRKFFESLVIFWWNSIRSLLTLSAWELILFLIRLSVILSSLTTRIIRRDLLNLPNSTTTIIPNEFVFLLLNSLLNIFFCVLLTFWEEVLFYYVRLLRWVLLIFFDYELLGMHLEARTERLVIRSLHLNHVLRLLFLEMGAKLKVLEYLWLFAEWVVRLAVRDLRYLGCELLLIICLNPVDIIFYILTWPRGILGIMI